MKLSSSDLFLFLVTAGSAVSAFNVGLPFATTHRHHHHELGELSPSCLNAKTKKKKKKGSSASTAGLKGFGSTTKSSSTSTITVPIDRSKAAMDFYSYLENSDAGTNLKRVALGFFPINSEDKELKLRGVVALKKILKGEVIIEIPYETAWNLGKESNDPTLPGSIVLQEYCQWISGGASSDGSENSKKRNLNPYLEVLPPFGSFDVLGSTDFFGDEALDMLQIPQIKEETLSRRKRSESRFEFDIKPVAEKYPWKDGAETTEEHLRWASWLVTSRVLTVEGEAGTGDKFRVMIPLIDMCNHDRNSPHILTGRAVPGGTLKVVAGKTVEAGEQVNIVYGGGVSGNDRFIQDYGFLDNFCNGAADAITAKILLGKARISEGAGASGGRPTLMPKDERDRALAALGQTTLEDDIDLLAKQGSEMENDQRSALEFRIGVKQALQKLGHEFGTEP